MNVSRSLLAGLDVGTTRTKAGLYRTDGSPAAERHAATPSTAEAIRDTALRLLAECVSAAAPPVALGVSSMAETGVPLDTDASPAGELLHWRDRRARRQADELADAVGPEAFFVATGLHPSAKLPLARWMWLRRNDPDVLRRMARWASTADLVVAALTGTVATSPTLAARTGGFDISAGAYRPELLDLAGLRTDQLPPVVAADKAAGRVTPDAARSTGLLAGTPVVVAGHDHLVAAWAAGVRVPGEVANSMGTAEAVVTPVASLPPVSVRPTGTSVGPYVDGRSFCLISGLSSSGGLVEWLLDRIAPAGQPDRHRWFAELIGPPGRPPTGITVQPYLQGRASPAPDPDRTLSFHRIRPEHSLADVGRAVIEGLCMQVRWMLDTQLDITGRRADAVSVFGGPTVNPTWMWIKAQLTPAPVVVRQQSAALGAAQLAGRAVGVPDEARAPVQPLRSDRDPAPEWEEAYRSQFLPLALASEAPDSEVLP